MTGEGVRSFGLWVKVASRSSDCRVSVLKHGRGFLALACSCRREKELFVLWNKYKVLLLHTSVVVFATVVSAPAPILPSASTSRNSDSSGSSP